MPKELIVSLNGREKKIAIIEDERVTEFYIERGESTQGIVGNIYKGRVMRVLPGMQSAFVDIGLERDAFLYVSDFFDEEEEFERIVIDKTKETADAEAARAAATERIERSRVERERYMETAQEKAEPILESGEDAELPHATVGKGRATHADPETLERRATSASGRNVTGGNVGRGRRQEPREPSTGASKPGGPEEFKPRASGPRGIYPDELSAELTPFVAGDASFQRVVDEDDNAIEEGAMLKDARLQERIFDQIHAVEFDMDGVAAVEVGSLRPESSSGESSFERVDDGEAWPQLEPLSKEVERRVARSIAGFVETLGEESEAGSGVPYERVSDDTAGARQAERAGEHGPLAGEEPRKKGRARGAPKAKAKSGKGEGEEAPGAGAAEEEESPAKAKTTGKGRAAAGSRTGAKREAQVADTGKENRPRRSRRSVRQDAANQPLPLEGANEPKSQPEEESARPSGEIPSAEEAAPADAEARLEGPREGGYFARRGGRRRRRPVRPGESVPAEEEKPNGNGQATVVEPAPVQSEPAAPKVDRPERRPPANRGRDDRNGGKGQRPSEGPRDGGGTGPRGGRDRRDRPGPPAITDLLREGQEILVQIAKEPISQKGARITSHIALPGRFLVYMPTIEHVGVSRKIESDSERVRLRKLIQLIRAQEDVPSGGFIVRTAGVGISEQDLRDDARYLVRTWRDIRRSAEKQKAPSLVHKDLDLVQRLLRDQLSEEFTAIRVDSEEEYAAIVEFINRIQPRLVNRVKLYTREEPILEAFGVQAEVEKAIKPRVWLRSGGYLVINQTEALVAIDVNTGKFVGRGGTRLEDTITRTNMEAVEEIARQIRLRDLGGIIVLDLIDMEERRNRQRVMQALQEALRADKSPTKVLSFNDFGLVIMTRKRVKQSLERTLCTPCPYCQGSSMVKSPQTVCYEILEEARRLARGIDEEAVKQVTLRINPEVARALRSSERDVLTELEEYLGALDITSDEHIHQELFDFAFV